MDKRWIYKTGNIAQEEDLVRTLGVHPIVAKLMVNRHIDSQDGARFLRSNLDDLLDPFALYGMNEAVSIIEETMVAHQSIVVYGDYDVDGITATSVLYRFLKHCGAQVSYYIPERQSEGYGLNLEALEHIIEMGTALVITVDCGISSYDIVEAVKDRIKIIITDHHTAPDVIPRAHAVINHKQPACTYPDKNLSGCGVAYKLCQALWLRKTGQWYLDDLDIVALGTVADVVPLVGENRIMVRAGLKRMMESPNLGIAALIEVSGLVGKIITAGHIGFTLAPRLNAAGRVAHATRAVELLTTNSQEEAVTIAEELQAINGERQELERSIFDEAHQMVVNQGDMASQVIVVGGEDWHPGVIGIVASRLVEAFYKPTLVLSIRDGVGKGSCRSIDGFNMYDALKHCEDLLIQFGGHAAAAGFSITVENIDALRQRLDVYCRTVLKADDYIPTIEIDADIPTRSVTVETVQEVAALEPYGMGNSTPIFSVTNAKVVDVLLMGHFKNHCKIILETEQGTVDAIAWDHADLFHTVFPGDIVNVAFTLQKNEWQGMVSPQLMIQDIRHVTQQDIHLDEQLLRDMYLVTKQVLKPGRLTSYQLDQALLHRRLPQMNQASTLQVVNVFLELGIIRQSQHEQGHMLYEWVNVKEKLDLCTSLTFMKYSQQEVRT